MRILILNWRDTKNPSSGGAEILTHELAKQWVEEGHEVTQLSSRFPGCLSEEIVDGVKIYRIGHPDARRLFHSVHFLSFLKYQKEFKGKVDVVIDEIHGVPFFTPWYVGEKKVALICEVAGKLWFTTFGPFFGLLGFLVEKFYLKFIYNKTFFLSISNSTKEYLIENGIKEKNIGVIPVGVSLPKKLTVYKKEKNPTLIFVGRVNKQKGVEETIYTTAELTHHIPQIKLWIVGRGENLYAKSMRNLTRKLHIEEKVVFYGYVGEEEKFALLGRAWILIHPSMAEGWGINVIEANAVGTPAVAYNVGGLKDSIQQEKTGILTEENTRESLVEAILRLISDKRLYNTLSKNSQKWAHAFSWQRASNEALAFLKNYEKY